MINRKLRELMGLPESLPSGLLFAAWCAAIDEVERRYNTAPRESLDWEECWAATRPLEEEVERRRAVGDVSAERAIEEWRDTWFILLESQEKNFAR